MYIYVGNTVMYQLPYSIFRKLYSDLIVHKCFDAPQITGHPGQALETLKRTHVLVDVDY